MNAEYRANSIKLKGQLHSPPNQRDDFVLLPCVILKYYMLSSAGRTVNPTSIYMELENLGLSGRFESFNVNHLAYI